MIHKLATKPLPTPRRPGTPLVLALTDHTLIAMDSLSESTHADATGARDTKTQHPFKICDHARDGHKEAATTVGNPKGRQL